MAIGHGRRPSRGGMPSRSGGHGVFSAKPVYSPKPTFSSPAAFGAPISPVNINIGSPSRHHSRGGGGLLGSLLGSAVSAGVGVASAAIVNKMHENRDNVFCA